MTPESIREALQTEPFAPFVIQLANGRSFDVSHPEFVFAPRGSRTIVVYLPDTDAYSMVDVLMINSLDFKSSKGGKGRKSKKAG